MRTSRRQPQPHKHPTPIWQWPRAATGEVVKTYLSRAATGEVVTTYLSLKTGRSGSSFGRHSLYADQCVAAVLTEDGFFLLRDAHTWLTRQSWSLTAFSGALLPFVAFATYTLFVLVPGFRYRPLRLGSPFRFSHAP